MKNIVIAVLSLLMSGAAIAQTNITAYQYWFDQDTSNLFTVAATPTTQMNVNAALDASSLTEGTHRLYIRLKDSKGNWSSVLGRTFSKPLTPAVTNTMFSIRYWIDTLNAYPNDMREIIFPVASAYLGFSSIFDFCSLSPGLHGVYYQTKDSRDHWSSVLRRTVNVSPPTNLTISQSDNLLIASSPWGIQWFDSLGTALAGETNDTLIPVHDGLYYATLTNACDTLYSDTVNFQHNLSGIHDEQANIDFDLYPNPAKGNVTLRLSNATGKYTLMVRDMVGKPLMTKGITKEFTTLEFQQPAGIYFVTMASDEKSITRKLIIE